MTIQPDLAPEGTIWACLACGDSDRSRWALNVRGCWLNVALCDDDKPSAVMGSQHYWRPYYEQRG